MRSFGQTGKKEKAMMRKRMIYVLLAVCLLLCGCGRGEDPYRVDTVVRIPVNPTEVNHKAAETEGTEAVCTEMPAEKETAAPTKAAEKPSSGGNKSAGNKDSSNKKEERKPKETKPKETEPEASVPSETEPVQSEPENDLYDISGYAVGSLEYALRDRINAERTDNALTEYSFSSRPSAIASCRANEISRVWSHTRPDGRHYSTVLDDYGYGAGSATELLVYVTGNGDAEEIAGKWLSSDSHRESLLGGFSTMGIGIYRAGGYTYVCCLLVS